MKLLPKGANRIGEPCKIITEFCKYSEDTYTNFVLLVFLISSFFFPIQTPMLSVFLAFAFNTTGSGWFASAKCKQWQQSSHQCPLGHAIFPGFTQQSTGEVFRNAVTRSHRTRDTGRTFDTARILC